METIETLEKQLKITMLATNSSNISELAAKLVIQKPYAEFIDKRIHQLHGPSGEPTHV
jgi:hypothetical protein